MSANGLLSEIEASSTRMQQRRFRGNRGDRFQTNGVMDSSDEPEIFHFERRRMRGMPVLKEKLNSNSNIHLDGKNETMKSNDKLTAPYGSSSIPPISKPLIGPLDENTVNTGNINENFHDENNGQQYEQQQQVHSMKNVIIAGILIGLIVVLSVNFVFLVYTPIVRYFRRKFGRFVNDNETLIERRYKTIDKWLIQKTIQKHDDTCRNIQDYRRLKNGESSLGRHTNDIVSDPPLSRVSLETMESGPPLCLTASFDTDTTHDCDISTSSDISSSFHDKDENVSKADDETEKKGIAFGEFDFERCKQQLSSSLKLASPLPHDNSTSKENVITQCRSFFLTREQVFDKIEITKSKNEKSTAVSQKHVAHDDYEEQECSICMEVFKVGDKISFSPTEGCYHVFHHDCLRRWLLRKTDCPCCRVTMLPIDRPKPKDCDDQGNEEESPQTNVPRIIPNTRAFLRTGSKQINRPWYHKNPDVRLERLNKKCGTYCCVACGVVVLKTHLREDLVTKKAFDGSKANH